MPGAGTSAYGKHGCALVGLEFCSTRVSFTASLMLSVALPNPIFLAPKQSHRSTPRVPEVPSAITQQGFFFHQSCATSCPSLLSAQDSSGTLWLSLAQEVALEEGEVSGEVNTNAESSGRVASVSSKPSSGFLLKQLQALELGKVNLEG